MAHRSIRILITTLFHHLTGHGILASNFIFLWLLIGHSSCASTSSLSLLDRLSSTNGENVTSSGSCDVIPVMLAVTPPRKYIHRCNTTHVLTFGCRGRCTSYVKVKEEDLTQINRMCRYGL